MVLISSSLLFLVDGPATSAVVSVLNGFSRFVLMAFSVVKNLSTTSACLLSNSFVLVFSSFAS